MQTLKFYEKAGFKLFPCNLDKSPAVASWRSSAEHLSIEKAQTLMDTGQFVGAWVPESYIIVDIDRNHYGKTGEEKADGMDSFRKLLNKLDILDSDTFTVKTGSGGMHLYFTTPLGTDYKTLSQKAIAPSVDVRTHLGYVIAAGTNGYSVLNDTPPIPIPAALLEVIQTRNKDKAQQYTPTRTLSTKKLKQVLNKLDASIFNTNDTWQEFITSCIAAAGNSDTVLDILTAWSVSDPNYANDPSIRKRIETFEPEGGITAGTFIHLIKTKGITKYLINQVRLEIGRQFTYSESFSDTYEPPFDVDYSVLTENKDMVEAFYYTHHQTAGVMLFASLTKNNLLYTANEKRFYYYNRHRWVETEGILDVIFSVLLQAGVRFYTDHSDKKDEDADEILNSYISFIGGLAIMQRFESALRQHPSLTRGDVPWDSPELQGTLTLRDSTMDFSDKSKIVFRQGKREEYRRRYIDLSADDFKDQSLPENFRGYLKDVFPDDETRKTATYALSTMLSGTGKFRKFQIWNGAGSNGKSTLMELMKYVVGERAVSYRSDILLSKQAANSLTPELAVFRGALVAFASETEEHKRISQGAVKTLTGDETISANPKYQGIIEFRTTFQVVLATNYLPTFSAHDAAFINRVLILPFHTCFYHGDEDKERAKAKGAKYFIPSKDPLKFTGEIKKERAQILYYLAKRYQELEGTIPESQESLNAKRHYIDDNNDIVKFILEMCEFSEEEDYFTPTKDLVNFYNEENNTRFSSKFVIMRVREVFPLIDTASRMVDGKLTRGLKHLRLKHGAYPEGYQGNFEGDQF